MARRSIRRGRRGGVAGAALCGMLLLPAAPAGAQLTQGRYVGSFHRHTGSDAGNTMSQQLDFTAYRGRPGAVDYRLGMSLNYFSRPGESGVDLLRSRFLGEVRDRRWRLSGQYVPWQDVSSGSAAGRHRNAQLHFDTTPLRAGSLALDYKRQDRDGSPGRSHTDDAQARIGVSTRDVTAGASLRRLTQDSDRAPASTTWEGRAGMSLNQRMGRSLVLQEGYDFVYNTMTAAEHERIYVTHRGDASVLWFPHRRVRAGASGFLRTGRTEDNSDVGDSDIDESSATGRIEYTPWNGLDLELSREYRSRLQNDVSVVSDYLRWEAILRRPLYRAVGFQAGVLNTTDLASRDGGWVPATTAFAIVDGNLRRDVAGRAELRVTEPTVIETDGLQWRKLLQLRTLPSRNARFEVTWWHDNQPRVEGAAQNEANWEFNLGIQPGSATDLVLSHRRLDGSGRQFRQERYGALNLTWKTGARTSVAVNASRRASTVEQVKSTENLIGADITFWMPRDFRAKLTWRHRTGLDLMAASSYGVTVDKSF